MIKLIFFLIFFIPIKLFSIEIKCNFEEVYLDGSVQQGFFLLKDQRLRYEYNNKNLFTIFHKDKEFFIVKNSDTTNFQRVQNNTSYISELLNIASQYPQITNYYQNENLKIQLNPSSSGFYKRISIQSEDINVSIYLNDCSFVSFHNRFYNYSPYFKFTN